jgi:hypothetical protein
MPMGAGPIKCPPEFREMRQSAGTGKTDSGDTRYRHRRFRPAAGNPHASRTLKLSNISHAGINFRTLLSYILLAGLKII